MGTKRNRGHHWKKNADKKIFDRTGLNLDRGNPTESKHASFGDRAGEETPTPQAVGPQRESKQQSDCARRRYGGQDRGHFLGHRHKGWEGGLLFKEEKNSGTKAGSERKGTALRFASAIQKEEDETRPKRNSKGGENAVK